MGQVVAESVNISAAASCETPAIETAEIYDLDDLPDLVQKVRRSDAHGLVLYCIPHRSFRWKMLQFLAE